ncbi:MAG: hypothetical protein C5B49_16615 [Bdellovibrio sp.]|nr:MAG: hypothetical protein C5B49_16615 [Bdellovibrio sp.]
MKEFFMLNSRKTNKMKFLVSVVITILSPLILGNAAGAQTNSAQTNSTEQEARINKLEDRILELEAQSALTKFRMSGVFINRYENLTLDHGLPDTDKTRESVHPLSMYLGLNVDFDVTKNLKFYSTFAMGKFFNNEDRVESLDPNSANGYNVYQATETGAMGYSGSVLKVDRAYASYEFDSLPLTLAIGRMPTNYGPPANQLDGLPRQGTYPRFIFNAIFDGVAAVWDFNKVPDATHTFKIRSFYQPFTLIDRSDRTHQAIDGQQLESSVLQYAVLAEYSLNDVKPWRRMDIMYMHAAWKQFYDGYAGTPGALGAPMTGQTEDGTDDGFYLGFEDIGYIGLNFSWTALLYQAVDSGAPDLQKKSWGHLFNINEKFSNGLVVGYEFVKTTPYFYLDEWTRLNLLPFYYLQNAQGHHVFVSFPMGEKVSGRVGYYRLVAGAGDVFQPEQFDAYSTYAQLRMSF